MGPAGAAYPKRSDPKSMKTTRNDRAMEIQDAIREVLYRDWDPIGVYGNAPEDEYDSYIGGIYRLLSSAPSRETVAQTLVKIEKECMGYDQAREEPLLPVADKLLAIDIQPKS